MIELLRSRKSVQEIVTTERDSTLARFRDVALEFLKRRDLALQMVGTLKGRVSSKIDA